MRKKRSSRAKPPRPTGVPCRLCGEFKPLEYSHILPEFIYKPLYDGKHEFVSVTVDGTAVEDEHDKGYREWLLCRSCEDMFSTWEDHGARVLSTAVPRVRGATPGEIIRVAADYEKLKLFQMSLLWRATVASEPTFCSAGAPEFEVLLRQLLLMKHAGPVADFPCIAVAPAELDMFVKVIGPGGRSECQGVPVVWLTFLGIHWFYFLSISLPSITWLPPISANRAGLAVGVAQKATEATEILKAGNRIWPQ